MSLIDLLKEEVKNGLEGKNEGIPLPLKRLSARLGNLQKGRYDLLGAPMGTGKTSLVDFCYVLMPILNSIEGGSEKEIQVVYNTLELAPKRKIAKFMSTLIFHYYGLECDYKKILGIGEEKMSTAEQHAFNDCIPILEKILTKITFVSIRNPVNAVNFVKKYAESTGTWEEMEQISEANGKTQKKLIRVFKPTDNSITYLVVTDHINRFSELDGSKKNGIDFWSNGAVDIRNDYYFAIMDISQFNRSVSNIDRRKMTSDLSPELEDFKETGVTQENADSVFALFDPTYYGIKRGDYFNYSIEDFKKVFRMFFILKNRDGDVGNLALFFAGFCGYFDELPKSEEFNTNKKLKIDYTLEEWKKRKKKNTLLL